MTKSQLCARYKISAPTLRVWIKKLCEKYSDECPFEYDEVKMLSILPPTSVNFIIEKLG